MQAFPPWRLNGKEDTSFTVQAWRQPCAWNGCKALEYEGKANISAFKQYHVANLLRYATLLQRHGGAIFLPLAGSIHKYIQDCGISHD